MIRMWLHLLVTSKALNHTKNRRSYQTIWVVTLTHGEDMFLTRRSSEDRQEVPFTSEYKPICIKVQSVIFFKNLPKTKKKKQFIIKNPYKTLYVLSFFYSCTTRFTIEVVRGGRDLLPEFWSSFSRRQTKVQSLTCAVLLAEKENCHIEHYESVLGCYL